MFRLYRGVFSLPCAEIFSDQLRTKPFLTCKIAPIREPTKIERPRKTLSMPDYWFAFVDFFGKVATGN